jgi:hypothetical protein
VESYHPLKDLISQSKSRKQNHLLGVKTKLEIRNRGKKVEDHHQERLPHSQASSQEEQLQGQGRRRRKELSSAKVLIELIPDTN